MAAVDRALIDRLTRPQDAVLHPGDPDYDTVAEMQAVEDWIADGCPPVEGAENVTEDERALLLARPLTVRQASRREAVSERTVYRWIKSGELEAHRAGRGWRIPVEALERRRVEAAKPKPKAPLHKRRPRRRKTTTEGTSWLS